MKLYATIKNNKGKIEGIGGDSIFIDLSYKNIPIGRLGVFAVFGGNKNDVGYRVVWNDENTPITGNIIKEDTKAKDKKAKSAIV
ncbi:MAG: hypothetical protein WC976_06480 [Caldisericia bacterium]